MPNDGWAQPPLGEVFRIERESCVPAAKPKAEFWHHSLPAFDAVGGPVLECGAQIESNKTAIRQPAVLVSKLNPRIPRVSLVARIDPARTHCASTEFMAYTPKTTCVLSFFKWFFGSASWSRRLAAVATGTTNSHVRVHPRETLLWPVELPPLDEQSRIAEILDTVDAAIRETEAVVAKLRQVKAGLLHDLLTRGLDAHGHLRDPARHPEQFQATPLGYIPKDWNLLQLGHCFDMQLGKMMSKDAKRGRRPLPYLGNRSVQWERADLSALEFMDFSEMEELKFNLEPGDVLICEGGEVGRAAIWRGELQRCCFQKAIHRLRPKTPDVSAEFLLMFMRRAVELGWLQNYVSQTSIAHLTQEKLAIVPFLCPKPDEQRAIAGAFREWNERISAHEHELSKLHSLKRGLAHDLLTGRVRVTV